MAKKYSGGTAAAEFLSESGVAHVLRTYADDPRVEGQAVQAAVALGLPPERVFRTVMFDIDGDLVAAILPVLAAPDPELLSAAVGGRSAVEAEPGRVEQVTGYPRSDISPFGQGNPHPTVLDGSAVGHRTVLVSAGRHGLDVEIDPADLISLTNARVAGIVRRKGTAGGG